MKVLEVVEIIIESYLLFIIITEVSLCEKLSKILHYELLAGKNIQKKKKEKETNHCLYVSTQ